MYQVHGIVIDKLDCITIESSLSKQSLQEAMKVFQQRVLLYPI